jgi:hypothetical protein
VPYVRLEESVVQSDLHSLSEHLRNLERKINRSRSNRVTFDDRPYATINVGLHRHTSGLDVVEYLITLR